MDEKKGAFKITPQFFTDKLYEESERDTIPARLDDRPPLPFVTLSMIEGKNRNLRHQSPPPLSTHLPFRRFDSTLWSEYRIPRTTSGISDFISGPSQDMSTSVPAKDRMLEDQDATRHAGSVPMDTSSTNSRSRSQRSALITHSIGARSYPESIEGFQDDPLADLHQVFDLSSVGSSWSRMPNPPARSYNMPSMNSSTRFGSIPVQRGPISQPRYDTRAQQNPSQNFSAHGPSLSGVRHDRDSLYTVRTRADGSTSLIKLPMQDFMRKDTCGSLSLAPTADKMPQEEETEDVDNETRQEFKIRLTHLLGQMMFVSGETAEPSTETTWMIEEIVRDQVIEMLKEATGLANRRGSKSISIVDLIFQIRHNPAKVSRLKTFLSWKDVRKNVKDSDDKAGGGDADALDLDEGALPGANPSAPQKTSTNKKAKLILPWEIQSYYSETVPEREDEEDEEEEEQNEATLARLASADERTKNMTREEYVYWSDCRQASFTFRKGKRFREWAGFGTVIDSKPNDDVVDILGFLTFEIVQTLTEEALKVKSAEDLANKKANGLRTDNESAKKRKREGCTLFEMPEEDRTPVEPKHVREAFRRLQLVPNKYKFMRQGYAGVRTPLRMI